MKVTATEFKAKCLALIDRVHDSHEPVVITKRGRVVAKLVAQEDTDRKPWLELAGSVTWLDDPLKPAIEESEIEALR